MIYATYNYLNNVCDKWKGFVFDDYKAVMPVAVKTKLNVPYLYQAPFVEQLGLFGNAGDTDFIDLLAQHFWYGNYSFYNKTGNTTFHKHIRSNYVLSLNNIYNVIADQYANNLKQTLAKANQQNLVYSEENPEIVVRLFQKHEGHRLKNALHMHFNGVLDYCNVTNNYICRGVFDAEYNPLTVALLLKYENRFYNLMNTTTIKGRTTEANHFLYDNIIKELAGTDAKLDLGGSDMPGVQLFYKKFGAENVPYYNIHINRLPFPLNLLKR